MTQKNVGIIGGGQLGMMLLESALENKRANYTILEASKDCPAFDLCDHFIEGNLKDAVAINKLSTNCDVLTWEIEHINVEALIELEKQGKQIIPSPRVLQIIQDKGLQKEFYISHNVPTSPFVLLKDNELLQYLENHPEFIVGDKVVVKSRTGGYDGKGVQILSLDQIRAGELIFEGDILLEQFVPDVLELSVIVAVGQNNEVKVFPSIEMYFNPESNLVEFLFSPAQVSQEIEDNARKTAFNAVESLQSAGLFAVEMFVVGTGEIWVNEIAPRPHNSGHHTIEGCETSQFEQLNKILLGESLGDSQLIQPSAMINIVGPKEFSGSYVLKDELHWLEQKDVFVHMYRKSESRPNRKLGHVTVVASTFDELMKRAKEVKETLEIIQS
ncbi:MAG: 5-(carboxyamino)imidazole ribonucleotide synthase [Bacteroidia bacterium]